MNDSELAVYRANTKAFIDADPITAVLTPQTETKGFSGTKMEAGAPRAPQTFRLIPQNDVTPEVMTPDGIQLTPTFVLLGMHDAAMDRWDTFSLGDRKFQIVSPIRPRHTVASRYESKGDVAIIG
jgi:hypothetical protein